MDTNLIARVCETYAYHGQLGLQQFNLSHCAIVVDSANPNVWSSNKVYAVVASRPDEVELLFSELSEPFQHTDYHHFIIDPLTPAPFEAALVVREFVELEGTLQMVRASRAKLAPRSDLEILSVQTHSDRDLLLQLVLADHAEGARTLGALSNTVSVGIVAGYRAKSPSCQFFLDYHDARAVAYVSGTVCDNGMGMVEDLFTLAAHSGRGIASSIIEHCVAYCAELGARDFLIGSHVPAPPKKLYQKLGFQLVCVTREYFRKYS